MNTTPGTDAEAKRREFLKKKTAERRANMKVAAFPIATSAKITIHRDDLRDYVAYRLIRKHLISDDAGTLSAAYAERDPIIGSRTRLLRLYKSEIETPRAPMPTWREYLSAALQHDRRAHYALDHAEVILDALKFARPRRDSRNPDI